MRNPGRAKSAKLWALSAIPSLAVQENFNVFAEGSDQRRAAARVEFSKNGANSGWGNQPDKSGNLGGDNSFSRGACSARAKARG